MIWRNSCYLGEGWNLELKMNSIANNMESRKGYLKNCIFIFLFILEEFCDDTDNRVRPEQSFLEFL